MKTASLAEPNVPHEGRFGSHGTCFGTYGPIRSLKIRSGSTIYTHFYFSSQDLFIFDVFGAPEISLGSLSGTDPSHTSFHWQHFWCFFGFRMSRDKKCFDIVACEAEPPGPIQYDFNTRVTRCIYIIPGPREDCCT